MEIWKDIKGYNGLYKVSNYGNIKSLKYKIPRNLKNELNGGYYRISLTKNGVAKRFFIHSLVCEYFNGLKSNFPITVVDHINGNPTDNRPENLQIISHRENIIKGRTNKTGFAGVYKNNNKYRSRLFKNGAKKDLGNFDTAKQAHEAYKKELNKITQNQ